MRVGGFGCPTLAPALYPVRAFPWGAGAPFASKPGQPPGFRHLFPAALPCRMV